MKRWAALTVLFYVLVLILLAAPFLAGLMWKPRPSAYEIHYSLSDTMQVYREWGFWLWLGVMALGQALLLLIPISLAERRPTARRPLFVPVATTGFFLGNLFLAGLVAALCACFREAPLEIFERVGRLARLEAEANPITSDLWSAATATGTSMAEGLFGIALALAVCWLFWAVLFYRFARSDDPASLLKRATRWLLRGSILDLLVAVPSHIIVRHRNDCCAPVATLWGIAAGISVMLLCFGPGIFFLFAQRFARLKPPPPAKQPVAS